MHGEEALHILISVVTISLAFTLFKEGEVFSPSVFFLVLGTVGLGFILHELAHKYTAIHYGAHAEYRAWTTGLFLALVFAFMSNGSFVFAAPGAVYIFGHVTREQNGRISLAGPLMNFALAVFFLALYFFTPVPKEISATGAYVNVFLGAFNMIPIFPLDGQKVASWSTRVWAITFAAFIALFFFIAI